MAAEESKDVSRELNIATSKCQEIMCILFHSSNDTQIQPLKQKNKSLDPVYGLHYKRDSEQSYTSTAASFPMAGDHKSEISPNISPRKNEGLIEDSGTADLGFGPMFASTGTASGSCMPISDLSCCEIEARQTRGVRTNLIFGFYGSTSTCSRRKQSRDGAGITPAKHHEQMTDTRTRLPVAPHT